LVITIKSEIITMSRVPKLPHRDVIIFQQNPQRIDSTVRS